MNKYSTDDLKKILTEKYGEKYIIPENEYVGSQGYYSLICPEHGEFNYRFDKLISGKCECPKCKKIRKIEERLNAFLEQAIKVHGDKYDYSLINADNFKDKMTPVPIVCRKHGVFNQAPINHVNAKQGCRKCYEESKRNRTKLTREEFIELAKHVHNNFYTYDNLVYHGMKKKVTITCPIHGDFEQIAYDHIKGFKCEKCKYDKNRDTLEGFITKARKIHGDKYDYSKVVYANNHTPITIVCPIHGDFQQTPTAHLLGCGCQKCHRSRLEEQTQQYLLENNIIFEEQKKFKWLGRQTLDFYLPEYNLAIECQGGQHFEPVYFGGNKELAEKEFVSIVERDRKKREKCHQNNVKLVYYAPKEYAGYYDDIYTDLNKIKEIFIKK